MNSVAAARIDGERILMPSRPCLTAGFVLIWASVVVITWGTYLRTLSPRAEEYEEKVIRHFAGDGTEKRLNPAGRIALLAMFRWQFVGCYCVFIGLLFTGGVLFHRALARWKRDFALVASGAFGLGCLVGALSGVGEAGESFQWGFGVLGVGYALAALGLTAGAVGAVGVALSAKVT